MYYSIYLTLVTYFPLALAKNCKCGIENVSSRIINGTEVPKNKYPWMVYVTFERDDQIVRCGGSVINNKYILTAGHCLKNKTMSKNLKVGLSTIYDENKITSWSYPQSLIVHPDFDAPNYRNDIGLIKLIGSIILDNVRPICLPTPNMNQKGVLTVAGWGKTENNSTDFSSVLMETNVEENEKCKDMLDDNKEPYINTTTEFCAASIGRDSCQGDSGSPLWKRYRGRNYQVGVVSFGPTECGSAERKAVYMKVSHYLDWIKKNTDDAEYCTK